MATRTSGGMIDAFYAFLDKIGYLHPIHPAMTHMPIGLVVGAVGFGWFGWIVKNRDIGQAAYYALVLAFIFWFPTVIFGYMDWQRYYAGAVVTPIIMKLVLAGILFILLLVGILLGRRGDHTQMPMISVYSVGFVVVGALGYFGGQLVYVGAAPPGPKEYLAGQRIFDANCTGCHAHGGNVFRPNLPLRSAPQLKSFQEFLNFIRHPVTPEGKRGIMPPWPPQKLTDQQVKELYDYIVNVIAQPKRKDETMRR